jgi:hypothetical protein
MLLAFFANFVPPIVSGRLIMLVASSESAGTLLGTAFLFPIYQWSLREDISFFAGGVPYYICAVSRLFDPCLVSDLFILRVC